jgi:CRP-like cAMP-binding protein
MATAFFKKELQLPTTRFSGSVGQSITVAELCGHASFALLAFSYTLHDLLPLRVTAVFSALCSSVFTYNHPHGRVLWLPFRWNLLFIAINVVQITKLLTEEARALLLSDEHKTIREQHLPDMSPTDFARLLTIAEPVRYEPGDVLLRQGEMNHHMSLVCEGEISCLMDGEKTYTINAGNFIAEAALHAGASVKEAVAVSSTLVATKPTTCLKMHRTELIELIDGSDSLKKSLQNALSWDIINKLKHQRHALTTSTTITENTKRWTSKRNSQTEERYIALLVALLGNRSVVSEDHFAVVNKYRHIHIIDDHTHEQALARCGWKPEEFVQRRKQVPSKTKIRKFDSNGGMQQYTE